MAARSPRPAARRSKPPRETAVVKARSLASNAISTAASQRAERKTGVDCGVSWSKRVVISGCSPFLCSRAAAKTRPPQRSGGFGLGAAVAVRAETAGSAGSGGSARAGKALLSRDWQVDPGARKRKYVCGRIDASISRCHDRRVRVGINPKGTHHTVV
jgi:hypothetical protein